MKLIDDKLIEKQLFKFKRILIIPILIFEILAILIFIFGFFSEQFSPNIYSFNIGKYRTQVKILSLLIYIFFGILIPKKIYNSSYIFLKRFMVDWFIIKDKIKIKNFIIKNSEDEANVDTIHYFVFENTNLIANVDFQTYFSSDVNDEYYLVVSKDELSKRISQQITYNNIMEESQKVLKTYSLKQYKYIGNKLKK